MKTLIIVHSYHHNNTFKIAQAMAKEIDAEVKTSEQAKDVKLDQYDLVGFGAGIDSGMHYKELLDFAQELEPSKQHKNCFIFSTAGVYTEKKMIKDHAKLNDILVSKGYNVIGDFSCLGFNTNVFLKYIGGINKTHPDNTDYNNARIFARSVIEN